MNPSTPPPGVDGKLGVAVAERAQSALKPRRSGLRIGCEADHTNFAGNEKAEWSRPGLEFGTEQAVQNVRLGRND